AMAEEEGVSLDDGHIARYQAANLSCWKDFERGQLTLDQLKRERFVRFNRESGFTFDPQRSSRRYQYHLSVQGILYKESIEVLTTLKERGYTLYLASNGIAEVQRGRIAVAQVAHFFDDIFISEEMGVQKPDVRYFETMLKKANLSASKASCLMIGDSLTSDIKGGIDSGMDTVWLNMGGRERSTLSPTYTITSLTEILDLLTLPH
ncbi:MAG TPA: HAD-IA family hydrolase, partial [Sphaerochaeta sp.]|nr:HAD-IA family hydrolase [Sphaerochaeta sp.]